METEVTSADQKGQNLLYLWVTSPSITPTLFQPVPLPTRMAWALFSKHVNDIIVINRDHPLLAEIAELLWDKEVSECRKKIFMH